MQIAEENAKEAYCPLTTMVVNFYWILCISQELC